MNLSLLNNKELHKMKRIVFTLFVVLITIGLNAQDKWTFMVYLDADCDLEYFGLVDMNEMEKVGSTSDVNIIVLMDRVDGYDDSDGDWTETRLYYVDQDNDMSTINSTLLKNMGEKNMGDPATLTEFINYGMTNYPADNYGVVLWNHGSGWYKSTKQKVKPEGNIHELFEEKESRDPMKHLKSVCVDETDGDVLYNAETGTALQNANGTVHLVGFDACLMAMIENAYTIKDYSEVMVGSEEVEPGDGWPYDYLLDSLVNNPTMSPAQFGRAIVNSYCDYYTNGSYYGSATQSVIDLKSIDAFTTKLDSFCSKTMQAGNLWNAVDYAHRNCENYEDPDNRDLGDFLDNFMTQSLSTEVQTAANELKNELDKTVLSNCTNSGKATGMAIYFPGRGNYNTSYASTGTSSSTIPFNAQSMWKTFLNAYYGGDVDSSDNNNNDGDNDNNYYDDPYEPNDNFAMAFGPVQTAAYTGIFYDDYDADIFMIEQTQRSQVEIDLLVSDADFDLYLYKVDGPVMNVVSYSYEYGLVDENITETLEPGVYYVVVYPYDYGVQGMQYDLRFSGISSSGSLTDYSLTLAYDWDYSSSLYSSNTNGEIAGCQYSLKKAPAKLNKIWYYIVNRGFSSLDGSFYAVGEDYYGELFTPFKVVPEADSAWACADLSDQNIFVYDDFIVGMKWDGVNSPEIGYDDYDSYGINLMYDPGVGDWEETSGIFYIRAELAYGQGEEDLVPDDSSTYAISGLSANSHVHIRPNPVGDQARVEFVLANDATVRVALYDSYGIMIEQFPPMQMIAGGTILETELSALPSGVYYLKAWIDGQLITKKVLKL